MNLKTIIHFDRFTDAERDEYAQAWQEAGGTVADAECSTPWCCPWEWAGSRELYLPSEYTMVDIARAMLREYPEAAAEHDTNW